MMNETARAYVIDKLDDEQLDRLHQAEKKLGYLLPSGLIRDKFETQEIGETPSDYYFPVERKVMAIVRRVERQWRARHEKCCFAKGSPLEGGAADCGVAGGMAIQHEADVQIRGAGIQFLTANSNRQNLRDKVGS